MPCPNDVRKYEAQETVCQSIGLHLQHMQHWHDVLQQQQKQQLEAPVDLQKAQTKQTTAALLTSSSGDSQALALPLLPALELQHTQHQQQLLLSSAGQDSALSDGIQLQQCAVSDSVTAAVTTATATTAAVSAVNTVSACHSPVSAGSDRASAVAAAAVEATQQIKLAAPGSASSTSSVDGESPVCAEEECCTKMQSSSCSEKTVSSVQQQHTVKAVSAAAGSANLQATSNDVVLGGGVSGADRPGATVTLRAGTVPTACAPEAQQAKVSHICTISMHAFVRTWPYYSY
jgi:hypothetical protein